MIYVGVGKGGLHSFRSLRTYVPAVWKTCCDTAPYQTWNYRTQNFQRQVTVAIHAEYHVAHTAVVQNWKTKRIRV